MDHTPLSQISMAQQNLKIKARVTQVWDSLNPYLDNEIMSIECILIDEKGDSIQASIRKKDISYFKDLLLEGHVYVFTDFSVVPNKKSFRSTPHEFMLYFNRGVSVKEVTENIDQIPKYKFNLIAFNELEKRSHNDLYLTDVIGQIVAVSSLSQTHVRDKPIQKKNLEIQDLEGEKMFVTLWGKFANEFDENAVCKKQAEGPIIIILTGMTVRTYQEKPCLCTSSASRCYINLEVPETAEFQTRLSSPILPISMMHQGDQTFLTLEQEMVINRKTVEQLLQIDPRESQAIKYTCKAILKDIDVTYGWWYKACYNCKSGVKTYGDTFWCSRCGNSNQAPVPWYKLNAIIEDETGNVNFIIFGRLAQNLIRIPALQLATDPKTDRFILPPVISKILGRTHVFQIIPSFQSHNNDSLTFKVLKIFEDTDSQSLSPNISSFQNVPSQQAQTQALPRPSSSNVVPPIKITQEQQVTSTVIAKQVHNDVLGEGMSSKKSSISSAIGPTTSNEPTANVPDTQSEVPDAQSEEPTANLPTAQIEEPTLDGNQSPSSLTLTQLRRELFPSTPAKKPCVRKSGGGKKQK